MQITSNTRHFLLASDFDQTLSFNDSGLVLADLLGVSGFQAKVDGLARSNLVQQGGELTYLIRHDPEFRRVRREHLVEAGRLVRLKQAIPALVDFLRTGLDGAQFTFVVISAAPRDVVESALSGMVPPDHIFATDFEFDPRTGEVVAVQRVPAGYGKVAVIEELERRFDVPSHRVIYVGDGNSDVHVMLHVNNRDGFTIAVSENRQLAQIARRTVLGENACSVMVPVLDHVLGLTPAQIRASFEAHGLALHDWEHARTDRVVVGEIDARVTASMTGAA
jgi:phosphoserine phosphatase